MTTNSDIITVLKKHPKLKHYQKNVLENALNKLISEVSSKLVHVRSRNQKVVLTQYSHMRDEDGDIDEELIEFWYDRKHYNNYFADDIVKNKNGERCFIINREVYLCPLCGSEIVIKFISGRIMKGGYTNRYYNGISQDMCVDCSKKIDKEIKLDN